MPFGEFRFAEDRFFRVELCGEDGLGLIACGVLRLEGVGVRALRQIGVYGFAVRVYGKLAVCATVLFCVELCDTYVVAVGQVNDERVVPFGIVFAVCERGCQRGRTVIAPVCVEGYMVNATTVLCTVIFIFCSVCPENVSDDVCLPFPSSVKCHAVSAGLLLSSCQP